MMVVEFEPLSFLAWDVTTLPKVVVVNNNCDSKPNAKLWGAALSQAAGGLLLGIMPLLNLLIPSVH